MTRAQREFGEGPLSRVASFIYTLIVVELMLVLASLPGMVALFLLPRDIRNIPLVAACAIPFGPALSAAIYALHHRRSDLTQLRPSSQFWHGYRINVRAVLPIWLIGLAWLTVVAVTLANFWVSGLPTWWAIVLILIGVLALLWLTHGLVITSLFDFRTLDTIRLAWEMIPRAPVSTLGNAGVIIAAVLVAQVASELLVAVLAVLFVLALVRTSRPMVELVTTEFTTSNHPE
ncbi:MAG TPA: hypothetical protein VH561_03250 [Micromonosporaceae bacterium]